MDFKDLVVVNDKAEQKFLKTNDFQAFFNSVYKMMLDNDSETNKLLLRTLKHPLFYLLYGESIVYLRDMIQMQMALPCAQGEDSGRKSKEKELKKLIVEKFSVLFPDYKFLGTEVTTPLGRIDILAIERGTDRPVIFELKVDRHNPNQQLIAYGSLYKNPILIGVVDDDFNQKISQIIYIKHSEVRK